MAVDLEDFLIVEDLEELLIVDVDTAIDFVGSWLLKASRIKLETNWLEYSYLLTNCKVRSKPTC